MLLLVALGMNVLANTDRILDIGVGAIKNLSAHLERAKCHGKAIVVTGSHVWSAFGGEVAQQLDSMCDYDVVIAGENSIDLAMSLAQRAILEEIDFLVGLGGGRCMDVGKYAAYVSKCPYVSIPTTISNDGLASPVAVLKDADSMPRSLGCAMPDVTVLDIDFVAQGPIDLIKAGIGDTISNITALMDWRFAERQGRDSVNNYAALMSSASVDSLLMSSHTAINIEFLRQLADSLVLSGIAMDFAGSSRPVSGSEHLFSHALDRYSKTYNLHGVQTALGTVAVLMLLGKDCSEILGYLGRFEVDVNPERLGISQEDFVRCFRLAPSMRPGRYTYLSEEDLSEARLAELYNQVMEATK